MALYQSSEPLTPPRPSDPSVSPWLHIPSAPLGSVRPQTPPGSLIPYYNMVFHSSGCDSSLHPWLLLPSSTALVLALPRPVEPPSPTRSCEPAVPSRPSGSLVSPWVAIPPETPQSPSVATMVSSRDSPTWLILPSTSPWSYFLAGPISLGHHPAQFAPPPPSFHSSLGHTRPPSLLSCHIHVLVLF